MYQTVSTRLAAWRVEWGYCHHHINIDLSNNPNGGTERAGAEPDALPIYRICYDHAEPFTPLIVPCACKGTIEHVHAGCLRAWIATTERDSAAHAPWCPLCRSAYQTRRGFWIWSWSNALAALMLLGGATADLVQFFLLARTFTPRWLLLWLPFRDLAGSAWCQVHALRPVPARYRTIVSVTVVLIRSVGCLGKVGKKVRKGTAALGRSEVRIQDCKGGEYH